MSKNRINKAKYNSFIFDHLPASSQEKMSTFFHNYNLGLSSVSLCLLCCILYPDKPCICNMFHPVESKKNSNQRSMKIDLMQVQSSLIQEERGHSNKGV